MSNDNSEWIKLEPSPDRPPISLTAGRDDDGHLDVTVDFGSITVNEAAYVLVSVAKDAMSRSKCAAVANRATLLADAIMETLEAHHECDQRRLRRRLDGLAGDG